MFQAGEYVHWWQWSPIPHTVDTFTTTENGTVMLPEELPIGLYQLEEIKAPNGYLLAKSGKPFRISGNGIHQQLGPDDKGLDVVIVSPSVVRTSTRCPARYHSLPSAPIISVFALISNFTFASNPLS